MTIVPPDDAPASESAFRVLARKTWVQCLFLLVVGFVVRVPALSGELIWDDQFLAHDNPFIKSPLLVLEVFRHHLFLDSFSAHYRPVQNISFIADYFFWDRNTYGFHLTNVLLHVGSGLLLYFLLKRLLPPLMKPQEGKELSAARPGLWSFWIALLWVVHPVHSAAVDYISGRADSLAFLFASGAWLVLLKARCTDHAARRRLLYFCSACAGLLALCSREIACIWFAVFLLHLFVFENGISRRRKMASLTICLALLAIYGGLRQLPERRTSGSSGSDDEWSRPVRTVLMLRALGDYGRLMIFPSRLHMERSVFDPLNYRNRGTWRQSAGIEYLSIAGLIVLATLAAGASWKGAGRPLRMLGAAWFLLAYLPISNLFEMSATSAEHWLYLPSVGFLLFLAGCAMDLPPRFRRGLGTVACIAVVGLSVRSVFRSSDWVTQEAFYRQTIAGGGVTGRAALNLGQIYSSRGEFAKAEAIFRRILELYPDYPSARNGLAYVLERQGKQEQAETMFAASTQTAVATRNEYPRTWIAAMSLARIRHAAKDDHGALAILERARRDYPGIWEIISFESEVLRQTEQPEAAIHLVQDFAGAHWWHYESALALGRLCAESGDVRSAEVALRRASLLDVYEVDALNLLALIRSRENRVSDAIRIQRRAIGRQPDAASQHALLAKLLTQAGRTDEAQAAGAIAVQLHQAQASAVLPN